MSTVQDFRLAARMLATNAVVVPSAIVVLGEIASEFGDDIGLLMPGQKGFQVRVWHGPDDPELDSNVIYRTSVCEVEVHRCLHISEMALDERLYTDDEMLFNQGNLLDASTWRDLASVNTLIEEPDMDSPPERNGNIISYTTTVTVRIEP